MCPTDINKPNRVVAIIYYFPGKWSKMKWLVRGQSSGFWSRTPHFCSSFILPGVPKVLWTVLCYSYKRNNTSSVTFVTSDGAFTVSAASGINLKVPVKMMSSKTYTAIAAQNDEAAVLIQHHPEHSDCQGTFGVLWLHWVLKSAIIMQNVLNSAQLLVG